MLHLPENFESYNQAERKRSENRGHQSASLPCSGQKTPEHRHSLYDPQTSGGLLAAIPEAEAKRCLDELREQIPQAAIIGYVTEKEDAHIILE